MIVLCTVGVGKTFLAHALGHLACARGATVLAVRTDRLLKTLRHARLDHTVEAEMRRLIAVDLLVLDDFGLDAMDPTESRDVYGLTARFLVEAAQHVRGAGAMAPAEALDPEPFLQAVSYDDEHGRFSWRPLIA